MLPVRAGRGRDGGKFKSEELAVVSPLFFLNSKMVAEAAFWAEVSNSENSQIYLWLTLIKKLVDGKITIIFLTNQNKHYQMLKIYPFELYFPLSFSSSPPSPCQTFSSFLFVLDPLM